jgi:1-acyl-sn-glycerol-3-phosphate acyltransferase
VTDRYEASTDQRGEYRVLADELSEALRPLGALVRGEVDALYEQGIFSLATLRRLAIAVAEGLVEFMSRSTWRRYSEGLSRLRAVRTVDEYGYDPVFADFVRPLSDFFYDSYWRVSCHDIEQVPASGRAMLVSNHSGTLPADAWMLMHAIARHHPARRVLRPMTEDVAFYMPWVGTFISRLGGVHAARENALRLLREDRLIAVFPEGIKGVSKPFRERYRLQRFGRGGFVKICRHTQTPLIPVAIIGAEEIYPLLTTINSPARLVGLPFFPVTPFFPLLGPLGAVPLPSKWTIQFGAPHTPEPRPAASDDDEADVAEETEQVRAAIQQLLDRSIADRHSIFLGPQRSVS